MSAYCTTYTAREPAANAICMYVHICLCCFLFISQKLCGKYTHAWLIGCDGPTWIDRLWSEWRRSWLHRNVWAITIMFMHTSRTPSFLLWVPKKFLKCLRNIFISATLRDDCGGAALFQWLHIYYIWFILYIGTLSHFIHVQHTIKFKFLLNFLIKKNKCYFIEFCLVFFLINHKGRMHIRFKEFQENTHTAHIIIKSATSQYQLICVV